MFILLILVYYLVDYMSNKSLDYLDGYSLFLEIQKYLVVQLI